MKVEKRQTRSIRLTADEARKIIADYLNAGDEEAFRTRSGKQLCVHPDNITLHRHELNGVYSTVIFHEVEIHLSDTGPTKEAEYVVGSDKLYEVKGTGSCG